MRFRWWVVGYIIALAVAVASPLASGSPDGLERVAEDEGFADRAEDSGFQIVPDYSFPGVENEQLATILAGVVGVTLMFALAGGLAYLVSRARSGRSIGSQ